MDGYSDLRDLRDAIRLRRELPPPEERRALRQAADISLSTLGRVVGVSHVSVHHWESGRKRPCGENLRRYQQPRNGDFPQPLSKFHSPCGIPATVSSNSGATTPAMTCYSDLRDLRDAIRLRRELPSPAERRALRQAADVSLSTLGRACGVSHVAIHHWEQGRRPSGENLRRYLDVLRVLREEIGEEEVAAP